MLTYNIIYLSNRIEEGGESHPVNVTENFIIEALNINQAFNHLNLKIGHCSIELISGPIERWNNAKDRLRKAYQKNHTKYIFFWRDFECVSFAHEMDDVQILESIVDTAERIADVVEISNDQYDIEAYLSDTYLLTTFYLWRLFSKKSLYIQNHCSYCGSKGNLLIWEISSSKSIQKDIPKIKYVCLDKVTCWQKALDDGYKALSKNRRKMVEMLMKQGKSRYQIRNVLRVSQSTINKDVSMISGKVNTNR